ncbi:MAG: DUF4175 family protein [Gemmatimonadota bacterium]
MTSRTAQVIGGLARPFRLGHRLTWLLAGLGAAALALGLAAWAAKLGVFAVSSWVLGAWAVAAGLLGAALWAMRRGDTAYAPARFAALLERAGQWRAGAVTSLLDLPAAGTSEGLLHLADEARAQEVASRAPEVLRASVAAGRSRILAGGLVLVAGLSAFVSARPTRGPAAELWHPVRAWRNTVAPVRLSAREATVDRGASVTLVLEAHGRPTGTLWLRAPGEPWRAETVRFDSTGRLERRIGPLQADLYARLSSGSRSSDTVVVKVRMPVFLGSVAVTARYPRYLELEDEPLPVDGDTIVVPAGTRLETRGEATAALVAARWAAEGRSYDLAVNGTGFAGTFTPGASGVYELALATASGARVAGDAVRLPIRVVPDSAPVVDIPVPGADTVAPLTLVVPILIDARDDHGLASVTLESRRISRLGQADAPVREVVPLPGSRPDRALLTVMLDLNRRGLLPGDTIRYRAVAADRAPSPGVGRSREFVLRLLTMTEVRAAQRAATAEIGGRIDSVLARSRALERQTEDLARERQRPGSQSGQRSQDNLSFQDAKRAEAVARSQEELIREAEQLEQALRELERAADAAGIRDSVWQQRLEEIRDQLQRAMSPELREKLAQLQQAVKDLDPERTRQSLEELVEIQKKLREALERSRELFRRAAVEGDLANLARESKDLAQDQRQWNDQMAPAADSAGAASQEAALAQRADSLAAALQQLARELARDGQQQGTDAAAEQAKQAAQQMKAAAQASRQGQRQQAQQKGRQAQRALDPLGGQLDAERQELQQAWREDVTQALDRLLTETTRLTERQLAVAERLGRGAGGADLRGEQGAIEEGVRKLTDQALAVAGKNALVSPQIGAALNFAQREMAGARDALTSATGSTREAAERTGNAVDALNAAAYAMLRSRDDISGSGSGSGMAEAIERMAQMAGKQGQLSQQAAGLLPQMGAGGIQEQLRQLGVQQRALAQQLERLRASGQAPGAGEMAQEAKELARRLEAGRLDRETVERQERLFRRMLDAGRTLQGQEEDEKKERTSTTAKGDSVSLPPALRKRLAGEDGRPRMPAWEELQRLTPEERRLVIDYFRRLVEGR